MFNHKTGDPELIVVHGIKGTYPRYQLDDSAFRMVYYFGRYEAFYEALGGEYDILYRKQ